MSLFRVPLWNQPGKFATVENGATKGAVIGRDVLNADGTLFVPAEPAAAASRVLWNGIVDVPPNVAALATLSGAGFLRLAGTALTASPIANADLAGADTDGLAEGSTNLYHTAARASAAAPVQSVNGQVGDVVVTAGFALAEHLTDPDGNLLTDPAGDFLITPGVTTTDLVEGDNLYFTDARADARVDAGITALKAEVDPFPVYTTAAEAAALANAKVADAIADGVTTVAPSQNAVFDALALKANDSGVVHTTGTETVAGNKTFDGTVAFASHPVVKGTTRQYIAIAASGSIDTPPATTEPRALSLGIARTGDGNTYVDFYSASTGALCARIIRDAGANGAFEALQRLGTGRAAFGTASGCTGNVSFLAQGTTRWYIAGSTFHFLPTLNAAYDIGEPTTNARNVYAQAYFRGTTQVVGARDTGWSAMTGTGSKAAIAAAAAGTASAAYVQSELQGALNRIAALEARLRSLDAALFTHGLIGT